YLKAKLKKENSQVVSATTQLKLLAPDGKKRMTDMLDYAGIIALGKTFPSTRANRFIAWFTYSDETIDGKSKTKAYALFESSSAAMPSYTTCLEGGGKTDLGGRLIGVCG
ncbi:MAG: hypothetical protein ABJC55_10185, partial [Algoriphagus sp.]